MSLYNLGKETLENCLRIMQPSNMLLPTVSSYDYFSVLQSQRNVVNIDLFKGQVLQYLLDLTEKRLVLPAVAIQLAEMTFLNTIIKGLWESHESFSKLRTPRRVGVIYRLKTTQQVYLLRGCKQYQLYATQHQRQCSAFLNSFPNHGKIKEGKQIADGGLGT